MEDPTDVGLSHDEMTTVVGVSDVPGGCVVAQWWGYAPSTPGVMVELTPGTAGYGMYGNPMSGDQGTDARDGVVVQWDAHPGGGDASPEDSPETILRTYLYRGNALAFCCDHAGLRPVDARAFTGPPDIWLRLTIELFPSGTF